jgi:hypothetical protein
MKTKHSSLFGVISWRATRTRIPIVLSQARVTVGWFWINNLATFAARNYSLQITITHRVLLSVTLRCNSFQWWTFRAQILTGWQPSYPNLVLWPLTSAATAARFRAHGRLCVICDMWWTKWHWDRFSPRTSVPLRILISPIAPHSSSVVLSWFNRPVSVRRTKSTESTSGASCRTGLISSCQLPN